MEKVKCVDCKNYQPEVEGTAIEKCKIESCAAFDPELNQPCPDFQLKPQSQIRQFETGATRDTDTDKLDYEGF
ncbi:MAG: hypothetical protein ACFFCM_16455, partial [Promethearchaeota archaeon]